VPVATTEKVAPWPSSTVTLAGWVVMTGARAVTCSTALRLVALPALLLTTTAKVAPSSDMAVAGVV
jgi:hypothetical protein